MRKIVPQMDQSGHQPFNEDQLMPDVGARGPLPGTERSPLDTRLPRPGQLHYRAGRMPPGDTREQPMREDRRIDLDRHGRIMSPTTDDSLTYYHAPTR
ncbi:hypothetical protein [Streptomyces sp. NPDC093149]|uniref:hypothetical protein n=1 Tax=Streptomyces sp. NPDC093149 TaxID=3366031 RepID=UPI0037FF6254